MRLFLLIAAAAAVPFIAQCSSTSNTIAPVPDAGVPDTSPTCDVHANAGTTFVDSTQDWGLAPIVGNRIASADLDGDGYPDLVIHAVSSNLRQKVGAPPVLVTYQGRPAWLAIYHGVTSSPLTYSLGALVLDHDDPSIVLARSREPVLRPEAPFEVRGFFGNVVFTCGVTVDGDTMRIYYGAADGVTALAELSIEAILADVA